jgi:hypothetical protein
MSEEPKSIWKKSFTGRTALVVWLAVAVFTVMLGSFIVALLDYNRPMSGWMLGLEILTGGVLAACLILIYVVWPLLRWLIWKHWRRTLFGLACFATLIALFYAEEDWRGKYDWEKYKRQEEAKGEKFDFKDFIPPPGPDDQNFALTPVVASCYDFILTRDGKRIPNEQQNTNLVNRLDFDLADDYGNRTNGNGYWAKGTLTDLKPRLELFAAKTNLFPILSRSQSPAADVLLALSKYDATVEELRQASLLPESRFPLNYDTPCPADILLPQLAAMKKSAQLLELRAIAELQNGQSDKALADVKLALRLTEAIRTEPFLISHLVRIAMTDIILQPIYEGLANHQWTDAQLVALDAELAKLDFWADYQFSLRGEVGMQIGVFEFLRQHPNELANLASEISQNQPGNASFSPAWLIPNGWFYQNQLRSARFCIQNYLPVVDVKQHTISPAMVRQAGTAFETEIRHRTPYNLLERMLVPALGAASKKYAREQISVDLARTAIALERYRLAHGQYPETLDALAPKFIAQVPHDVIGGGPLHYRREANGQFILYSVGWNETDDGGVTGYRKGGTVPDFDSGDWVWRYPKAE